MGIDQVIARLRRTPELLSRITRWETIPARDPQSAPVPADVPPALQGALRSRGIDTLYSHQAEAWRHARAGRNVIVTTPTASGKTLCYNLPVLSDLLEGDGRRALYLFPTKALSQDQVAELTDLLGRLPKRINAYTYDGDTPVSVRRRLRESGDLVVSNPYMLHTGILPNHPKWSDFFRGLRWVVLDEAHVYRGVFGSHVANVIRRLKRVAGHYGARPVFLLSSATLRNPVELAERVLEDRVTLVDRSGAPTGEKHFLVWNPPLLNRVAGVRGAALEEARRLAELLRGVQSIWFLRSRTGVEVMTKYLKDLYARSGDDPEKVRGYRGGYLPDLRREIEAGLRAGRIEAVAATNALELGIDIGSLDASVLVGYPGTVASAWQQAGRAGRRRGSSLAVLIARNAPVDQYVAEHPEYLFEGSAEAAALDPDNLVIRANHLKCSAFELPFRDGDRFGGAPGTAEILEHLEKRSRILHHAEGLYHWAADAYPAEGVSLNAADVDNFVIHDLESGRAMGEVDRPSAITEIHPGAVYGLLGDTYLIEKMEWAERRAYARAADLDYYTQALTSTDVRVTRVDREEERGVWRAYAGEVVARTVATVYKKIRFYTGENVGAGEIHLPEEEMETTAFWFTLDPGAAARAGLLEGDGARALPGLANVFRGVTPLLVRCDPGDVRSACEIRSPLYLRPALFLFDRIPGGVGLAEQLHALHPDLFEAGRELVARCPCEIGCPSCVGPPGEVGAEGKRVARAVLAALTGRGA